MIKVTNKVVFLPKGSGGMMKENQLSANIQGKLKKMIIKVEKLKTSEDVKVMLTGSYKDYEIKVEPKDAKLASKIIGMLKKRD